MARPLRIEYEYACYHVTSRGNGRQRIFLTDSDRKKFLELLARSLETYQVRLVAFVLMTNHFHLIVKTPRANLKGLMRHFNISYTAYFNNYSGADYSRHYCLHPFGILTWSQKNGMNITHELRALIRLCQA